MFRSLFSHRLFIGALAVFVLCVGGSLLYMQHVERETAREWEAARERLKEFTEKQKPTAEAPVGETLQGGHFHADGTWHEEPHEPVEQPDEIGESLAEFKARVEKDSAALAAAESARERNEINMRRMKASPYFDVYYENVYNFYKAHPDFDHANHETNSPELKQKYVDAVYADNAKARAYAAEQKAEYERNRYKNVDMSPFIPGGGNR